MCQSLGRWYVSGVSAGGRARQELRGTRATHLRNILGIYVCRNCVAQVSQLRRALPDARCSAQWGLG